MTRTTNVLPLHRGVRPIPVEHYERIFAIPSHEEQDRIQQQLRDGFAAERMQDYGDIPPGVAAAEMLVEYFRERGDLFVAVCAGAALGMLATVGLAYVWSVVLS